VGIVGTEVNMLGEERALGHHDEALIGARRATGGTELVPSSPPVSAPVLTAGATDPGAAPG
jgi:hypothetical protein